MGGVCASANLRGGGEYGEAWHQAGHEAEEAERVRRLHRRGRVPVAKKYTSPEKLAIQGGSNGGLLVGAVHDPAARPVRRGLPQVGVMDMLRFHKFTIGWYWIADYGSSDDAEEFKALYAYSPLHNLKPGAKYPATLVTTADTTTASCPGTASSSRRRCRRCASRETAGADPHRDQGRPRREQPEKRSRRPPTSTRS